MISLRSLLVPLLALVLAWPLPAQADRRTLGSTLLSVVAYWVTYGFVEARHRHAREARRKAKH